MALVNQAKREINSKIVFYGPGLAGKATNVKHIYNKLKPEFRGAIKAMNVQDARMLFFDFTPPGDGNVEGFRVRFHVYTVSGNLVDPAAWKMVLKGVDGIVFIADSHPQRQEANRESLDSLLGFLKGYGQSLASIPLVFQYNKTDLPEATPAADLERTLNPSGFPSFKASSHSGEGVLQTLMGLVKTILSSMRSKGVEGIVSGESLQRIVEGEPGAGAPGGAVAAPAESPTAEEEGAPLEAEPTVAAEVPAAGAEDGYAPEPSAEAGFGEVGGGAAGFGAAGAEEPLQEELSLEVAGAPQPGGPGQFRIPLTIRSGSRARSVTLTVAVSLDEE